MQRISLIVAFCTAILIVAGFFFLKKEQLISPLGKAPKEKPLDKYTFERLKKTSFTPSSILLGRDLKKDPAYISQMFYFKLPAEKGLQVSGQLNVPQAAGTYPVILMIRGFVPKEQYQTGIGTQRAGEIFAKNGFITLAPDFLGYGESDNPSSNSIEERLQTYTTMLTLIASLKNLNEGLTASYSGLVTADINKIGIWGHSNGGHIALSVLSISAKPYPTVLWSPVSKPFPYSILYYTDEFDDHGKALRKVVANFEKDYDAEDYSPTNYYQWIQASLQIHQGDADNAVPQKWSDQLVDELKKRNKDVTYFVYPGADHNLLGGWSLAVEKSMAFYREYFQK